VVENSGDVIASVHSNISCVRCELVDWGVVTDENPLKDFVPHDWTDRLGEDCLRSRGLVTCGPPHTTAELDSPPTVERLALLSSWTLLGESERTVACNDRGRRQFRLLSTHPVAGKSMSHTSCRLRENENLF
jgi:hypothetical protein